MEEKQLNKRLRWFQDLKFGLFVHWGPYSQKGWKESWPLCEQEFWARDHWVDDMEEFKKEYWALNETFHPENFDPNEWAEIAKQANMKYFVFTTKHHDGFNMYDTQQSDYKITNEDCPYHDNQYADITDCLFDVFRKQGLAIGVYFSKADLHSPYWWIPGRPAVSRSMNYDPEEEEHIFEKFDQFVYNQIRELMSEYGRVDILWLDGGRVKDMDRIVEMARSYQPGLIVADRGGGGKYENYMTPEQRIPLRPPGKPWETCMTMGDSVKWSYNPDERYKSTKELVHILIDVVAKGGNLLLNVGACPDGTFPEETVTRLLKMGEWLDTNGEAVFGTRIYPPYRHKHYGLTTKGDTLYVFYMFQDPGGSLRPKKLASSDLLLQRDDEECLPETLNLPFVDVRPDAEIRILGSERNLSWDHGDSGLTIEIPTRLAKLPPSQHACVFKIKGYQKDERRLALMPDAYKT